MYGCRSAAAVWLFCGSLIFASTALAQVQSPMELARELLWTGRYDEAAALAEGIASSPNEFESQLIAARAHLARGRLDKARAMLAPLLARGPLEASCLLADLSAQQGKRDDAERVYLSVVRAYNDDDPRAARADGLTCVARAARALEAFKDASAAFAQAASLAPDDAEIQVAWAELFFDKHDLAHAEESVRAALKHSPMHPHALELFARVRLAQNADFGDITALLDRAASIHPNLVAAHVTRARMALRDLRIDAADAALTLALAVNPADLEALSVRAATRFLAGDAAGFAAAESAVLRLNPSYSRMYSLIAEHADWEHRYPELVALADKAIALDPRDAHAHATRGLNLLRLGDEAQGRASLERAWNLDRYDVQVFNTLNLYDEVIDAHYVSYRAGPFLIRIAKNERRALEPYLAPLLNKAYDSFVARYRFTPAAPIHIELYADAQHFSVRTTGLPNIGVQGVCFGQVVTAVSPAGAEVNWGQILWHELSHVFHVQLSNNRVPRWVTEGLAEYETELARPEWKREEDVLLYRALNDTSLPHLRDLNMAFTHAHSEEDLVVAYHAAARAMRFASERFGFDAVRKWLAGYADGSATEALVLRHLGISIDELDVQFRSAMHAQLGPRYARDFFVDLDDYGDLEQRASLAAKPEASAKQWAEHAVALASHGDLAQARARAEATLKRDPHNALAHFVVMHVALVEGRYDDGEAAVEAILAAGQDGYMLRMLRAKLALRTKDFARARVELEHAAKLDPDRPDTAAALVALAEATGDLELERSAAMRAAFLDQHARAPLARALELSLRAQKYADVRSLAESGVYLDPANPALHVAWAKALEQTGRKAEAAREAQLGRQLSR